MDSAAVYVPEVLLFWEETSLQGAIPPASVWRDNETAMSNTPPCCIQQSRGRLCVFAGLSRYVPLSASSCDPARQWKGDGPSWAPCLYPIPSLTINALATDMIIDIDADLPDFKITFAVSQASQRGSETRSWLWTWLSCKLLADLRGSL